MAVQGKTADSRQAKIFAGSHMDIIRMLLICNAFHAERRTKLMSQNVPVPPAYRRRFLNCLFMHDGKPEAFHARAAPGIIADVPCSK